MEINNLLTHITKSSSDTKKYLAIEIGRESIKTAVWEVLGIKPHLLATGTIEEYSPDDPEQLVTAVDTSLSKTLQEIDPEPDEVVFSFPESWVEGTAIAPDKKPLLKILTKKLDLKPIGFVVTVEALIHYLKTKQGGPFTGILIGVTDQEVVVTLVKNGSISESHTVGRSSDLGSDVEEGVARFSSLDSLPANMILYNGHTQLDSEKQELISYNWQDKLPFLHIPKIDTFNPNETIQAVVEAGGAEVIKSLQVSAAKIEPEVETASELETDETDDGPEPETESIPDLSDEFGFTGEPASVDNFTPVIPPQTPPPGHRQTTTPPPSHPDLEELENLKDLEEQKDFEDLGPETKPSRFPFANFHISLKNPFKITLSSFNFSKKGVFILALASLIIALVTASAVLAAYWYLPTAEVTIFLNPKTLDTNIEFSIDPNLDQPDLSTLTIPGRIAEAKAQTQVSTAATGEKIVGDSATGTVTLYNRSDASVSLPRGTKLIGPDSLTYTIDQEVNLASASTKPGSNKYEEIKTPSTEEVAVSAVSIGAKYNLGQGTELRVADYGSSILIASAATDIDGGTSREITAVAASDIEKLRTEARQQLEEEIISQYSQEDNFIGAIFLNKDQFDFTESFSADVGDEATSVSLEAQSSTQVMTYTQDHVNHLIEKQLLDSAPEGYQFLPTQSSLEIIRSSTLTDNTVKVTATAQAKMTPILDDHEVINNLRGRFPSVTEDYFQQLPGFDRVEIDIQPKWLPDMLKTFPRLEKNITIHTST